jgi:hypothetical protein
MVKEDRSIVEWYLLRREDEVTARRSADISHAADRTSGRRMGITLTHIPSSIVATQHDDKRILNCCCKARDEILSHLICAGVLGRVVCVAAPAQITYEEAKGFGLFPLKAALNGRGDEVLDLARVNLLR